MRLIVAGFVEVCYDGDRLVAGSPDNKREVSGSIVSIIHFNSHFQFLVLLNLESINVNFILPIPPSLALGIVLWIMCAFVLELQVIPRFPNVSQAIFRIGAPGPGVSTQIDGLSC
jgi:hypothetical protein